MQSIKQYCHSKINSFSGLLRIIIYSTLDSMPSLGMITINGLSAADHVIIPVQPASFSLNGLQAFIKTIGMVKRQIKNKLHNICIDISTSALKKNE